MSKFAITALNMLHKSITNTDVKICYNCFEYVTQILNFPENYNDRLNTKDKLLCSTPPPLSLLNIF